MSIYDFLVKFKKQVSKKGMIFKMVNRVKSLFIVAVLLVVFTTQVFANINIIENDFESYELDVFIDYYLEIEGASIVSITLNPNGGSVSPTSINRSIGSSFGALPTPTRTGRVFIGWFDTSATSGGTRITSTTIVPSSVTLWARWNDPSRHLASWWPSANANTTNVPLRSFNFDATWQTPMNNAIANWNSRNTPISFTTNSTSNNTVTSASRADTWYGLITRTSNGSNVTRFEIVMNSRTITNSATNLSNFITSVFAHELGHAIGLADNPAQGGTGSIMSHARNRNTITVPSAFDVASVNILYSNN